MVKEWFLTILSFRKATEYANLSGWFNAYGVAVQNTSADIFVHLGDYVRRFS